MVNFLLFNSLRVFKLWRDGVIRVQKVVWLSIQSLCFLQIYVQVVGFSYTLILLRLNHQIRRPRDINIRLCSFCSLQFESTLWWHCLSLALKDAKHNQEVKWIRTFVFEKMFVIPLILNAQRKTIYHFKAYIKIYQLIPNLYKKNSVILFKRKSHCS